ncbi:MAG: phospholipase D-like domain-containing protein, partial [Saezia sp.]
LLLVNQYFQYNKLARQIKHWKNEFNQEFKDICPGEEPRTLYLFLGTCKAENHGMLFRTQQMANEFGVGEQLGTAFDEMYDKDTADADDGGRRQIRYREEYVDGEPTLVPNIDSVNPMPHIVTQDMDALGIKVLFFMFYTQIPPASQRNNPADHVAQQVYVHAKLMIEDDVFFTLGSANTNIRSMAVDSELNIITDDLDTATPLRHKLLGAYAGIPTPTAKFPNEEKILGQAELKKIYEEMLYIADKNCSQIKEKKTVQGLIALYNDDRTVDVARKA